MLSSPARRQYICRGCIESILSCPKSTNFPALRAQTRYKSTDAPFRVKKHYGKLGEGDNAMAQQHGLPSTSKKATWKSGLKFSTDDGQDALRPRKRPPKSDIRSRDTVEMLPEIRRTEAGKRSHATASTKTPSFIRGRQLPKTRIEEAEFEFLKPSEPSAPPPPVKIWSPEKPLNHMSLHFGKLGDFNWYWETLPPTIAQKTQAQHFFTKGASPKFLQSVGFFRSFPESDVPEIAFVGRSNVGKSSLLNAIVNADTKALLARTSATPGFTKTMNLYGLGPQQGVHYKKQPNGHGKIVGKGGITIVDMPGYGEGSLIEWGTEIMKYLQGRKQLRRVFVLIDAMHGIKDKDRSLLASLRLGGISHQVILSKVDKIYLPEAKSIKRFDGKRLDKLRPKGTLQDLRQTMEKLREEIQPPIGAGAIGEILACSSEALVDERRLGIDAVRFAMLQAINFPFRNDQSAVELAKKEGPRIRAMKTDAPTHVEKQIKVRTVETDKPEKPTPTMTAREMRAARRAGRARGPSAIEMLERLSGKVV
ncbi:uncharacterized protein CC84DRAFT_1159433 [Paraphaeosphaeria sporulosa]|uniref:EngB-type G domain-containing protein n=1 Tax=Paraphaeosphaeria sporulosa TaxID=1460663 RepID=A0A177CZF4_9PLEO|nr:uncharacterized protein CC84DRAFT_1159433 [Paraphaeosphaeria sporulosa]OAG12049.1 hypothetical protein CC84DRAFT_1159433 [Paraphaeosphaeria sporulosa]